MNWSNTEPGFLKGYWLVVDLPLWKMMEFVSWDDEIPNIWENKNVPNHQPDIIDRKNDITPPDTKLKKRQPQNWRDWLKEPEQKSKDWMVQCKDGSANLHGDNIMNHLTLAPVDLQLLSSYSVHIG